MRSHGLGLFAVLAAIAGLTACRARSDDPWSHEALDYVQAIEGALILQRAERADTGAYGRELFILDMTGKKPGTRPSRMAFSGRIQHVVPRSGTQEGLALIAETDDGAGQLVRFDHDGEISRIDLSRDYARLSQASDGRHVALFDGSFDNRLLESVELDLVDLEGERASRVQTVVLQALRTQPDLVTFLGEMQLDGGARSLVAVFAEGTVSFFDVAEPQGGQVTIDLSGIDASGWTVLATLVDPDSGRMFLQTTGSRDLIVVEFFEGTAGLSAVLSSLSVPGSCVGLDRYSVDGADRVLCRYSSAGRVLVAGIDPETNDSIELTPFVSSASELVELGEGPGQKLLLSVEEGQLYSVDLRAAELFGLGAARKRLLSGVSTSPSALRTSEALGAALVSLENGGVGVANLQTGRVGIRSGSGPIDHVTMDERRLGVWLSSQASAGVAFLSLDTLTVQQVELARPVVELVPLLAHDRLVAFHDSPWGLFSVIDADAPEEDGVEEVAGVAVTGVFD